MKTTLLVSVVLLATAACDDEPTKPAGETTTGGGGGAGGVGGMPAEGGMGGVGGEPATCGPAALCARTIGECMEPLTQTECEGWYADASNCADMAAYTTCNCDCITAATCSDYFACGNLCFNDSCM